jgi:hypothetical protein
MAIPVALLVLLGSAALAFPGNRPPSPVRFEKNSGWYASVGEVHTCPGVPRSRCTQVESWAATIRWRDCAKCGFHRTASTLSANGIAIYLVLGSEPRQSSATQLRWPPRIRAREAGGPFEGLPRQGYFGRGGRLRGFSAQLFVFFGRPDPTATAIARANAELRSAKLP